MSPHHYGWLMQNAPSPCSVFLSRLLPIERWALLVVLGMTLARLVVAGSTLLSADEAYYWQWTHPLHLSYYDHPAMVAYWIWTSTHLLGETALGVRLPAVLSSLAVSALLWDCARIAFRSRVVGAQAALWLNCTILFGSAGIVITPDAPLLLAWSLVLWALVRLIVGGQARYIYIAGLGLGLGAISKYTMLLIMPGIVATFLLFPALRPWWRRGHTWAAALLALVCTTPLLLWNFQNNFASFSKQLNHAFASEVAHPGANLVQFLASQVGLLTPLIFAFCLWGMIWALWNGGRAKHPEWFLLGTTSLPILLFFIKHTQSGVVQANWSGPVYIAGVITGVGGWQSLSNRSRRLNWAFTAAPALGLAMTLLVYFQAVTVALPIPVKIDALKRLGGWDELAAAVHQEQLAHPGTFLFTQKHEPTGVVTFYLPDHQVVFLNGGYIRPPYYTAADVAALRGRDGIFITRDKDDGAADLAQYFAKVTPLRKVRLHWGRQFSDAYNLYLAEGYRGGNFVQGDGQPGAFDAGIAKP